jgi:hypothetical protein
MSYLLDRPDSSFEPKQRRFLQSWQTQLEKLGNVVISLSKQVTAAATAATPAPAPTSSSDGVQGTLGQAAQPQQAQASFVASLPPTTDVLSQTDTLVSLNDTLYRYNDTTQAYVNQGAAKMSSATSVTASADTTANQDLMSWTATAGQLNLVGKRVKITAAGVYSTHAGQTPTLTFGLYVGSTALITWTPIVTSGGASGLSWSFDADIVVATAGASGALQVTGRCSATPGTTPGQAVTTALGANTAPITGIDLSGDTALTIQTAVSFSTNVVASNSCTQLSQVVEVTN